MTTEQILQNITSKEARTVWKSTCEIVREWQNPDVMLPLTSHLSEIEGKINELRKEGLSGPEERFADFAIKTLRFYNGNDGCRCNLYMALETFNPQDEKEKGNVEMMNWVQDNDRVVDYYIVRCVQCGQVFKAVERNFGYTLWAWMKNVPDPWTFDYNRDFPSPDKTHKVVYEHLSEVAMGAPLRGDGYLETEDKRRIKIHDSCGGPPVWHTSGKMVALPIWTYEKGQRMGVVDLTEMSLKIFNEPCGVLEIESFDKTVIDLGYKKFDIKKKSIDWVIKLA